MNLQTLKELPDRELLVNVKGLVQNERQATAALVAHLDEIECRKLYLAEGCRSLFTYCTQVLHLAEHAAYNRIEAARIAHRFPSVLTHLAAGDVHLTAVRLLGPLLTAENHLELLAAAKHQSKRQTEELVARLRPQPDVQAVVRKLPGGKMATCAAAATPEVTAPLAPLAPLTATPASATAAATAATAAAAAAAAATATAGATATAAETAEDDASNRGRGKTRRPGSIIPLAPERYKVQFTASAATCAKLRRAQELLRHRIPDGDVAAVIDQALDLLVCELEKKKFAATARPQPARLGEAPASPTGHPERSRHIPAAVKRAVWQRDAGRCTFTGSNGFRCTERGQLEFDHVHPHADGGPATAANLRLLCKQHNQYEARLFFGVWQADTPQELHRPASRE